MKYICTQQNEKTMSEQNAQNDAALQSQTNEDAQSQAAQQTAEDIANNAAAEVLGEGAKATKPNDGEWEAKVEPKAEPKENEFFEDDIDKYGKESEAEASKLEPTEFEQFTADPINKAFVEWRKKGGVDFDEFTKEVGYRQTKSDIKDLLREEVLNDPLVNSEDEDDVEASLETRLAKYEDLSPKKKEAYFNSLKQKYASAQQGVFQEYVTKVQEHQQKVQAVQEAAVKDIQSVASALAGKKYQNLIVIPKEDVQHIVELAKNFTPAKMDQNGIPSYDTRTGLKYAIRAMYHDTIVNEAKKVAAAQAKEEILKERINKGTDDTSGGGVPTATDNSQGVKNLRKMLQGSK